MFALVFFEIVLFSMLFAVPLRTVQHHMVDNPDVYYKHLVDFIREVESGEFNK